MQILLPVNWLETVGLCALFLILMLNWCKCLPVIWSYEHSLLLFPFGLNILFYYKNIWEKCSGIWYQFSNFPEQAIIENLHNDVRKVVQPPAADMTKVVSDFMSQLILTVILILYTWLSFIVNIHARSVFAYANSPFIFFGNIHAVNRWNFNCPYVCKCYRTVTLCPRWALRR